MKLLSVSASKPTIAILMEILTQAVDSSQIKFRSVPSRELFADKVDILIKMVEAIISDEYKEAVALAIGFLQKIALNAEIQVVDIWESKTNLQRSRVLRYWLQFYLK